MGLVSRGNFLGWIEFPCSPFRVVSEAIVPEHQRAVAAANRLTAINENHSMVRRVVQWLCYKNTAIQIEAAPSIFALREKIPHTLNYIDWHEESIVLAAELVEVLSALRTTIQEPRGVGRTHQPSWWCAAAYLNIWYSKTIQRQELLRHVDGLHFWHHEWRPNAVITEQSIPTTEGSREPFNEWLARDPEFRSFKAQGQTRKNGSRRDSRGHK